ncbi:GDSL-type esterase/lipase family protein [Streptomyces sp. NPDC090306]|uniref:GDSL-type esterase/lipase family protein n=1 Tax=Streptomyces sp. NPDC090306 TaxID=3365961 RepID=UPI003822D33B
MLRIMPVGDSMTIGSAGEHTWRYRMWQHLRDTLGAPFTFVGPRETLHDPATGLASSHEYAEPAFPRAHLAGWGEGWTHMAPLVGEAVRTHRADLLLVSLGLIDLGFYTNADQTQENVTRFVREVRAANSRASIAVMPVIPNVRAQDDADFAAQVTRFNTLLVGTLDALADPHARLLLVPPPPDYDIALDTYDGTHPNARGEHAVASAFAGSLAREWNLGEPYAPAVRGA